MNSWRDETCETCVYRDNTYCRQSPAHRDVKYVTGITYTGKTAYEYGKACAQYSEEDE